MVRRKKRAAMRNKYPGTCYRCGKYVAPKAGHFERHYGRWRVQHADCAIEYRNTKQHFLNKVGAVNGEAER